MCCPMCIEVSGVLRRGRQLPLLRCGLHACTLVLGLDRYWNQTGRRQCKNAESRAPTTETRLSLLYWLNTVCVYASRKLGKAASPPALSSRLISPMMPCGLVKRLGASCKVEFPAPQLLPSARQLSDAHHWALRAWLHGQQDMWTPASEHASHDSQLLPSATSSIARFSKGQDQRFLRCTRLCVRLLNAEATHKAAECPHTGVDRPAILLRRRLLRLLLRLRRRRRPLQRRLLLRLLLRLRLRGWRRRRRLRHDRRRRRLTGGRRLPLRLL